MFSFAFAGFDEYYKCVYGLLTSVNRHILSLNYIIWMDIGSEYLLLSNIVMNG